MVVILLEVDNLTNVGLEQEEENCDVVLLLLRVKGEAQFTYDIDLMIQYHTNPIKNILVFRMA